MIINLPSETNKDRLENYLKVLSAINPSDKKHLTATELMTLTYFILLPEKYKYQRFSYPAKMEVIRRIKEDTGEDTTLNTLGGRIAALIKKGYLWRDTDSVIYLNKTVDQGAQRVLSQESYKIIIKV